MLLTKVTGLFNSLQWCAASGKVGAILSQFLIVGKIASSSTVCALPLSSRNGPVVLTQRCRLLVFIPFMVTGFIATLSSRRRTSGRSRSCRTSGNTISSSVRFVSFLFFRADKKEPCVNAPEAYDARLSRSLVYDIHSISWMVVLRWTDDLDVGIMWICMLSTSYCLYSQ